MEEMNALLVLQINFLRVLLLASFFCFFAFSLSTFGQECRRNTLDRSLGFLLGVNWELFFISQEFTHKDFSLVA